MPRCEASPVREWGKGIKGGMNRNDMNENEVFLEKVLCGRSDRRYSFCEMKPTSIHFSPQVF